jgi:TonB family protein
VLVAALFRPPALNSPTLGEASRDVAQASRETPFPVTTVSPLYPPQALFDGVVLVEVLVGIDGRVEQSKVLRSAPPFDAPALDAARQWTFLPALVQGVRTETFAYIVFGFRQPVTSN